MGLRFRKTISILPGVKLNLGKSSASVSVGVPGFRKSFSTRGTTTTSVGLPGTGLYYTDTKRIGGKKKKDEDKPARSRKKKAKAEAPETAAVPVETAPAAPRRSVAAQQPERSLPTFDPDAARRRAAGMSAAPLRQVTPDGLLDIHKTADDSVDWQLVLAQSEAPDASYNAEMWRYYHSVAEDVLRGDIDTYLKVIYEVNPLDDLLDYGSGFSFGTDDPKLMEVEFDVNEDALLDVQESAPVREYYAILQDFVCSTAIRAARDIFALLPVERVIVHAQLHDETILSASFDWATMSRIRFGFVDPSDTMARFRVNMAFEPTRGFAPVERLV